MFLCLCLSVFPAPLKTSMINDSALQPTKEVFVKVAYEIFSDGKFNWGRVVALFYFACRLVIKVRARAYVSYNLVLYINTR